MTEPTLVGELLPGVLTEVVDRAGHAQVGHEQAILVAKLLDHPTPAPPVLWPAVEQQHRRPGARLGQMQSDAPTVAPDVHPTMLDTGQGREPVQSRRRGRNGHDINLSLPRRGANRTRCSYLRFYSVSCSGRSG
jgi:hypothetical protein